MIYEIFIYFFIVFGVLQFSVCIWEFLTGKAVRENAIIVIKPCENLYDVAYTLKKYPLELYAVTEDIPEPNNYIKDIKLITKEQLLKELE